MMTFWWWYDSFLRIYYGVPGFCSSGACTVHGVQPTKDGVWHNKRGSHQSQHGFTLCLSHCEDSIPRIQSKYSQKWNCAASVPVPTVIFLWAIYTFFTIYLPIQLQKNRWIDPWNLYIAPIYINCENWDWGRAVSFLGVHKSDFLCNAGHPFNIYIVFKGRGQGVITRGNQQSQPFFFLSCAYLGTTWRWPCIGFSWDRKGVAS